MKKIESVLVVEDFPLMAESLKQILYGIYPDCEIQTVSLVADAEKKLGQQAFDLMVVDIQLYDDRQAGLKLIALARQKHAEIRIVIYTQFDEPDIVQAGILAGAHGYVVKYESEGQLKKVFESVAVGDEYLSPVVARTLIRLQQKRENNDEHLSTLKALTPDELVVIKLIGQDINKKEIAAQMGVSSSAIYVQIKRIAEKIGVVGDVGIALFARKHGLI